MVIAALPADEDLRLKDLYNYDLLDTNPEADFDDLVELAGYLCGCPISIITLVDKDRQWFKSQRGLDISETSRKDAFCSHAILQDGVFEVHDASKDERFYDNPLVTGKPDIRFYAGCPIISPAGYKLGTICVIDHTPKTLSAQQEKALKQLSKQAGKLIELREKNKLIRQRATEIIDIKSNAIAQVMQQNRSNNKWLAYNLHEGLAQEIAGSLLNLQFAEKNETDRWKLIDTVKEQLQVSLAKIKEMSYHIAPLTSEWLPVEDLVAEFIEKIAGTFPFNISFSTTGKKNKTGSNKTSVLIHIIEAWLTRLHSKKKITKITVTLHIGNVLELTMEDDAAMIDLTELSDHVYASLVKEMAIAEEGEVDICILGSEKNLIKVIMPFGAELPDDMVQI